LSDPSLNLFTDYPDSGTQQWFQNHFFRMGTFSPYFDTRTSGFPRAQAYLNTYGIDTASPLVSQHPDWIMHDQYGNWLYIPFDCNYVTCPHYAGDFSNPAFRAWWIANAKATLANGYIGLWLDDVNMDFRASNAGYGELPPIDYNTGQPMTIGGWRSNMATFLEQIRQALPGVEIEHNSLWFANTDNGGNRDADPYIQRQIAAADVIHLERGIASDAGLTGGTGPWSVYQLLAYIDRVHAAGKAVTLGEYTLDPTGQEYGLAGYFLISNGSDRYGDMNSTPNSWWSGLNVNLGTPSGARTYNNGLFRRDFSGGTVLLNEPGAGWVTVPLNGTYTRIDGSSVTSVTLGPKQGAILLSSGAVTAPSSQPVSQYISDLTPSYVFNSWGTMQKDLSILGKTLSLNGATYSKGLGVHAYSEVRYPLSGACSAFTATVGIDGEIPPGLGSAAFQVWADGHKLFDSGTMTSGSPAANVSVSLTGYQNLSLVMTNGTYNAPFWSVICDHGDWANAVLTCTH